MSMKCETCKKYKLPDPSAFKVGDKVSFKKVRKVGRSIRMSTVDGVVSALVDDQTLSIRHRGQYTNVKRTGLTMQGSPSPLTYEMFGVCKCEGVAA